jgi:cytochrome P450
MSAATVTTRPALDFDLYTDDAILDPLPRYRAIRDAGTAVWLAAHEVWAIGRFADVRDALRADAVLVSGRGIGMNDLVNTGGAGTTLMSDGELHRARRGLVMKPMMPSALRSVRAEIERLAAELVDDLAKRDGFDGVADFARHLPLAVVSHLVGLPEEGREKMLAWAAATFDAIGPPNARAQAAVPLLIEMAEFAQQVDRGKMRPDGWGALLFAAADAGHVDASAVGGLLVDYIAPSLDTTVLGAAALLHLLGSHPAEYEKVRANPALVPAAVHEALRLASPVRAFTRVAAADYAVGGTTIAGGERVLVLFASANRDERRYEDPDRFDVLRDARDHVAFGHGVHRCAGGHLAQLELEALLRALIGRVRRIEVGAGEPLVNNVLHGYRAFAASFG